MKKKNKNLQYILGGIAVAAVAVFAVMGNNSGMFQGYFRQSMVTVVPSVSCSGVQMAPKPNDNKLYVEWTSHMTGVQKVNYLAWLKGGINVGSTSTAQMGYSLGQDSLPAKVKLDVYANANNLHLTADCSLSLIQPPAQPTLSVPFSGGSVVSSTPALYWLTLPDASSYHLQVSTDQSFSTTVVDQDITTSTPTATSFTVNGLAETTKYYWRVNATNSAGTSPYSSTWNFTSAGKPTQPTLISPVNGATGVALNPTLTWNGATGATSYEVSLWTVTNTGTVVPAIGAPNTTKTTSFPVSGLAPNTTYSWYVTPMNNAGAGFKSVASSFTTGA